jgi:putative ABC transport system permease protein
MTRRWLWSVRFALAEIRHEWLFALGVALAVCSVITTTSLLWGTRSGMITSLRERLMRDPTVRELAAVENVSLPRHWFDNLRNDPRVDFVVPSVGRINRDGVISTTTAPIRKVDAEYLPTAPGDPLGGGLSALGLSAQPVPCVVSALVAEELGVAKGTILRTEVTRNDKEGIIRVPLALRIDRVLNDHESRRRLVLLPLAVIESMEDFKEGWAVPSLEWPPSDSVESPAILDALTLIFPKPIPMGKFMEDVARMSIPCTVIEGDTARLSRVRLEGGPDGLAFSRLERLLSRYADANLELQPYAEAVSNLEGRGVTLRSEGEALKFGEFFRMNELASIPSQVTQIQIDNPSGIKSQLLIPLGSARSADERMVSPRLAGILGAAKRRPIVYDDGTRALLPAREGYAGFRLYAKRLEDVVVLRRDLAAQGIKTRTNEDRITAVLTLDAALGKFLAFIITAGAMGGCGALFASIHLSVERSRRSFAVFQLMGIPTLHVVASAVIQAILLVCVGTLFAFVLFQTGSRLLIAVFSGSGEAEERVCVLSLGQWGGLLAASLFFAVMATLPALIRTRCADPAVIARGE